MRQSVLSPFRRSVWAVALACASVLAAGCSAPIALRYNAAETHGKVYYLDGIACLGFGYHTVPQGFRQAGYPGDVEYWSWSATKTAFDQLGGAFIRAKGKDLAEMVQLYQSTYPGRPVSLIGLSGGTGVAVFACEYLPDGAYVDEVILVASSLSEHYNLTKALRHVRGNITLYQSSGDLALGVGARLMGTIDGAPLATAAGLVGFSPPRNLKSEEQAMYARVKNVPYSPAFAALGFDGGHTSAVESPPFVRYKMAPLVMAHRAEPGTDGRPAGPVASTARGDCPPGPPLALAQPNAPHDPTARGLPGACTLRRRPAACRIRRP